MPVRLRLARHGTRNNPFYHIVAIYGRKARNAKPIELLGVYDPIPRPPPPLVYRKDNWKEMYPAMDAESVEPPAPLLTKKVEWNLERVKYWLDVGGQPSTVVSRLLRMVSSPFPVPVVLPSSDWYFAPFDIGWCEA